MITKDELGKIRKEKITTCFTVLFQHCPEEW
jgi:hypothetical protein